MSVPVPDDVAMRIIRAMKPNTTAVVRPEHVETFRKLGVLMQAPVSLKSFFNEHNQMRYQMKRVLIRHP